MATLLIVPEIILSLEADCSSTDAATFLDEASSVPLVITRSMYYIILSRYATISS